MAELTSAGWQVLGLGRNSRGVPVKSGAELIDWVDLTLPSAALDTHLSAWQPELLVHAAGPASVPGSVRDPWADFEDSTRVTFSVLDGVRRLAPECQVILMSSAAVYGNPASLPVGEAAALHPISPYGYHKWMCELMAAEHHTIYALRVCTVRIFSAYGPRLRRQVLWDICQKAVSEPEVELWGTENETRDFINGRDVARAMALLAQRAAFTGEVYNLASGIETSIGRLAEWLLHGLGQTKAIRFNGTQRKGDPLRWRADVSKLSALGYEPSIALADGAQEYARWFQAELAARGQAR
jgi:UDP-glucose 4-epimerase